MNMFRAAITFLHYIKEHKTVGLFAPSPSEITVKVLMYCKNVIGAQNKLI